MTPTEAQLYILGGLMLVCSGLVYVKSRSSWLVVGVVVLFMVIANRLGLLA